MRHHAASIPEHEGGVKPQGRRYVPHLHPPLGSPAQELDLLSLEMRASRDGGRPVIVLDPRVDDESALTKLAGHWRSRIGCRVLDVRPVHVLLSKCEVRF